MGTLTPQGTQWSNIHAHASSVATQRNLSLLDAVDREIVDGGRVLGGVERLGRCRVSKASGERRISRGRSHGSERAVAEDSSRKRSNAHVSHVRTREQGSEEHASSPHHPPSRTVPQGVRGT